MKNKYKGSTFDSFLEEENLETVEAVAIKHIVAYELEQAMKKQHINIKHLTSKMHTSRSALDR